MTRPVAVAALASLIVPFAPAAAGDAPRLTPERDVAVTYQTNGGNGPQQRLRWSAATRRLRLEPPAGGMFVLIDYPARRMDVIRDADRSFLEMDAPATVPGLGAPPPGRYTQGKEERVAGLACTEWAMASPGEPANLCFTPDGVLLRVRLGAQVVAAATEVSYAAQDASLFRVPGGYARVEPPR